jgi:F0F1-type ATP synthase membrane subunit c/vacuolar-type H+-ATPase subunit K
MSRNIALTIIFSMCILGPALVMAATGYSSIGALGRNPSAAPKIFTAMTITLIFVESLAIIAFLVVWQLFAKIG